MCDSNLYHGTWENHKAVRVEAVLAGCGPEEAFPHHERWKPAE